MRQLSALDAWLLDLESPTATGHVGTLVSLDPSDAEGWGTDQVRALLEPRLHTVESLSQRLVGGPFGLGGRYLVDDPDFDIEFHVRELVLPAPGTTEQLADQVAAIHARPLDRSRPLWQLHVVTGLADGRAAVYAKVHRTLIDVSGAEVLQALLDAGPEPVFTGPEPSPVEAPAPSALDLLGQGLRSLADDPRQLGYLVPDALHRLGRFAGDTGLPGARVVGGLAETAGRLLGSGSLGPAARGVPAPRTRLDAPLTPHRRLAVGSVPLDHVERAAGRLGITVDDMLLVATASALRRWFLDHDALPAEPLVAAVPILTQATEGSGDETVGVTPALVELPTHLPEAAGRARSVQDSRREAVEDLDVVPSSTLEELAERAPLGASGLASHALSGLALIPGKVANVTVTHQPRPVTSRYLAGAKVEHLVGVACLGPATGGLAVTSYAHDGGLHIGLTACREIVPDVWRVLDYLTEALADG